MKRILYIINDLKKGGAETNLFQIIKHSNKSLFENTVISLAGPGFFEDEMKKAGANVILLDFKSHPLRTIFTIKKIARNCDVVSCWMYHANAIGYYSTKRFKNKKIIWNIRHSNVDRRFEKKTTVLVNKYCRRVSKKIDLIVYNGVDARNAHERFGYYNKNSIVLDNGCDVEYFNGLGTGFIKKNYDIEEKTPIIISVGRNHSVKDPETFIRVLRHLKDSNFAFKAFMCGEGYENNNHLITKLCSNYRVKIDEDIFLLGQRDDINNLLADSDFFILHSASEAFPNVLIQAMSSKCICISTNVGDAAKILGNNRFIADVGAYKEIGDLIIELWNEPKETLDRIKNNNRQRIIENYNVCHIVKEYEMIL